jgi:hypothetical protein
LDIARLRESFGRVAIRGDELPLCSDPFIKRPEVGDLFPVSAAAQRGDVAAALVGSRAEHDHIRIEDPGWSTP